MVIITKGAIHAFAKKHPAAAISVNDCYNKTKEAQWGKFSEAKLTFNSVDAIGNDRYIFNIGGNNFSILTMIHFDIRTVFIRAILTHAEYDILNKMNKLIDL